MSDKSSQLKGTKKKTKLDEKSTAQSNVIETSIISNRSDNHPGKRPEVANDEKLTNEKMETSADSTGLLKTHSIVNQTSNIETSINTGSSEMKIDMNPTKESESCLRLRSYASKENSSGLI